MAWKEYRYSSFQGDGEHTYRPYLRTVVSHRSESITLTGLIDSGCETTMVNSEIAESLGVDMRDCRKIQVGGVGGKGSAGYLGSLDFVFPDFKLTYSSPVIFADIPISLLLGHNDFFKHFKILFEGDGTFKLNPIKRIMR